MSCIVSACPEVRIYRGLGSGFAHDRLFYSRPHIINMQVSLLTGPGRGSLRKMRNVGLTCVEGIYHRNGNGWVRASLHSSTLVLAILRHSQFRFTTNHQAWILDKTKRIHSVGYGLGNGKDMCQYHPETSNICERKVSPGEFLVTLLPRMPNLTRCRSSPLRN